MKKLILLGDSIRMGYQREVEEILRDRMEVFGPNENGRWSGYTLNSLRFWMPEWPGADSTSSGKIECSFSPSV